MSAVERVTPQDVQKRMPQGLLLISAYDNGGKFAENHLEGALSLSEFQSRLDEFSKEQELVFYCR